MDSKQIGALTVIETGSRLGLTKDAVKRRIGGALEGYKDRTTGWWFITLQSIEAYEAAELAAAKAEAV